MKKIRLRVNGTWRELIVDTETVLLDLLREDLRLTGAKQSCDRKGQCGACTVVVNGKAVRSCLARVADLEGADIITVEGLGTPDNPHLIQEAFVLSGAIQCGFCTPGMIMAAKALLDTEPGPHGRGDQTRPAPEPVPLHRLQEDHRSRAAGRPVSARRDHSRGRPAQTGSRHHGGLPPAAFRHGQGLRHGVFHGGLPASRGRWNWPFCAARSPMHASSPSTLSEAEKMPGVAGVLTAADIKGTNILKYLVADRPVLCKDKVRYIGDPILAVAADTRENAEAALEKVQVQLEPLPTLSGPEAALAATAVQLHADFPTSVSTSRRSRATRKRPCGARPR